MSNLLTTKVFLILSIIGLSYAFMMQKESLPLEKVAIVDNHHSHEHDHLHGHPHTHHDGEGISTNSPTNQYKLKTGQGDFVFFL